MMYKSLLCCRLSELPTIKWWATISSQLFRNSKFCKNPLKLGAHSIGCMLSLCTALSGIGYREYSSIATRRYFFPGKGPTKSAFNFCQGPFSIFVMDSGTSIFLSTTAWQGMHCLITCSTCLSIPGNHTFPQSSCFVLDIPKCPSWAN